MDRPIFLKTLVIASGTPNFFFKSLYIASGSPDFLKILSYY